MEKKRDVVFDPGENLTWGKDTDRATPRRAAARMLSPLQGAVCMYIPSNRDSASYSSIGKAGAEERVEDTDNGNGCVLATESERGREKEKDHVLISNII